MRTIDQVLDRAQQVQKVRSDYKLGLCLGIGQTSISSYRSGRSLPDEKAASKLAAAIGEEPELLLVEIQAQRVKDPEARELWARVAKRLQKGFADVYILAIVAMVSIAAITMPAWAAIYFSAATTNSLYIMLSRKLRKYLGSVSSVTPAFVKLCKAGRNVPSNPHPAAFIPA